MNYLYLSAVVKAVVEGGRVITATKYVSPKEIIRARRTTYKGKIIKRDNLEITLTYGRPNYLEREFIKKCKQAGEPFPVKYVQLKLYTPKTKKLKPHGKSK